MRTFWLMSSHIHLFSRHCCYWRFHKVRVVCSCMTQRVANWWWFWLHLYSELTHVFSLASAFNQHTFSLHLCIQSTYILSPPLHTYFVSASAFNQYTNLTTSAFNQHTILTTSSFNQYTILPSLHSINTLIWPLLHSINTLFWPPLHSVNTYFDYVHECPTGECNTWDLVSATTAGRP